MSESFEVTVRAETKIQLEKAAATFFSFTNIPDGKEHVLLRFAGAPDTNPPLVRIHSECLTGDVFGSLHCDCGPQLQEAIRTMSRSGGYIVYLRQEGRGIGLYSKLEAYALQATGLDTFEANGALNFLDDYRVYQPAALMLRAVGVSSIRLLTNNPEKASQLNAEGIDVTEVIPTGRYETEHNSRYIRAKETKTKHLFSR